MKYCIKSTVQDGLQKVYQYEELKTGIKLFRNGILDGIMSREYFQEKFIDINWPVPDNKKQYDLEVKG